jgi:signal transduction histidine kinase
MDRPAGVTRLAALVREQESRATSVARLLHDETGPALAAIGFSLRALKGDPAMTEEVRAYLEQAMETVRAASRQLHTNVVERSGLPMAVQMLVDRTQQVSNTTIQLDLKSTGRCTPPTAYAIYRILELSLDNIVKHSKATNAEVVLSLSGNDVSLRVADNGRGFAVDSIKASPPGMGLILMEQYAGEIPLHLRIDSFPDQGTIIMSQTK